MSEANVGTGTVRFSSNTHRVTFPAMRTLVSIDVVTQRPEEEIRPVVERARGWFKTVEKTCCRLDASSELHQLCIQVNTPVPVGRLLWQALTFALSLARETDGAFDPTVGTRLESSGGGSYVTGGIVSSGIPVDMNASYHDVKLDHARRTVTLQKPLLLNLGGVAKGLAIDLAARELSEFDGFCIEAGGDVFVGGRGPQAENWQIGVQHPRESEARLCVIGLSNQAVWTSGDYQRPAPDGRGYHLIDPRTGRSPDLVVSATAVAPTALLADGLSTAAIILGPPSGIRLLEQHDVEGLIFTSGGNAYLTSQFARLLT